MDNNDLILKCNPKSIMTLHLDQVFKTYKTKKEIIKCSNLVHGRKILKFIMKNGEDEHINQLEKWLKVNSELWFKEFEKLKQKMR